jgi:hypothetical protein
VGGSWSRHADLLTDHVRTIMSGSVAELEAAAPHR